MTASLSEFFAMGGYAEFVWPAYAVTFIAIFASIVGARAALRRALDAARRAAGEP